ncbi:COP23 domain-containing protein [Planktothricoides raciborskii]|uniref:COP23 domain-containing protein n=1 Tax=Planktothricoides raciborskii GIHE-MW2 TaxID=2792601 RepID=A0AAU8JMZ9_9CYAN|nr:MULTISPECIES: COP23 domain-containing protein [Planktothricoides]
MRSRSSSRVSWHRAGERQIIQWTEEGAQEFGENLTASERCRAVRKRFNQYCLRQSAQPTLPPLSEGVVNGMPVICAAAEVECSPNNTLWTLKTENRDTNGRIIAQLLSALKGEAGTGLILESEDDLEITSILIESLIDGIIMQKSDRLPDHSEPS